MEGGKNGSSWYHSPKLLMTNFVVMALCFSVNHATVVTIISVASSKVRKASYYSTSVGTLYLVYTLSALLVSSALVKYTGSKWALVLGLLIYVTYPLSFFLGNVYQDLALEFYIVGGVIGGFAAGFIWTAQGAFFSRTATLYAQAKNIDVQEANSLLSGIFACIYVGVEVIFKALSWLVDTSSGNDTAFDAILTISAGGAGVIMILVKSLPSEEAEPRDDNKILFWRKIGLAWKLLRTNKKMKLLVAMNCAFGCTSAFMNGYVNGKTGPVVGGIGKENVAFMSAVTPLVASLMSMPFASLGRFLGKGPMMIFGATCYMTMGLVVAICSENQLASLQWGIVFLYILGGFGRSVFEGTNKAVFADFFPHDKEAAFANVVLQSGAASTIAFFFFPPGVFHDSDDENLISGRSAALITAVVSLLAIVCLVEAFRTHAAEAGYARLVDRGAARKASRG